MPPRGSVSVQVEPDYFQFYARRAGAEWASDQTSSVGFEEHLWSNGQFVTIGTARKFGTTSVDVEVWERQPSDESFEQSQHVAEVSLGPGGPLEVFGWGDDTPTVVVPIDEQWVRLRVLWDGLVAGRYEGMDEDGMSDEHLLIQIWRQSESPPAVLHWWSGWVLPPRSNISSDGRQQVEGLEAVLDRLSDLSLKSDRAGSRLGLMPGGGENSSVHAVLFDPTSETWWVDGYDIRRTLREVTRAEAEDLMSRDPSP